MQKKIGLTPDLCSLAKILTGGLPGGAVAGRDEFMQVMVQTGDEAHDRFQRVAHGGTFNANPYCAATGNAALSIVASGDMQAQADRMAERLRHGLQEIITRHEVPASVYGEASTFHVYFGAGSLDGLDANTLKNVQPIMRNNFRQALQVRGVDLMSRCSGVLSGVHTGADIDKSLEAFDGAIKAMMQEDLIRPD
ncbi:Glutamate-1-semialdehyde 2,1-aminomutase [Candidatus Entotheonellaceae bacterium PAL068K]